MADRSHLSERGMGDNDKKDSSPPTSSQDEETRTLQVYSEWMFWRSDLPDIKDEISSFGSAGEIYQPAATRPDSFLFYGSYSCCRLCNDMSSDCEPRFGPEKPKRSGGRWYTPGIAACLARAVAGGGDCAVALGNGELLQSRPRSQDFPNEISSAVHPSTFEYECALNEDESAKVDYVSFAAGEGETSRHSETASTPTSSGPTCSESAVIIDSLTATLRSCNIHSTESQGEEEKRCNGILTHVISSGNGDDDAFSPEYANVRVSENQLLASEDVITSSCRSLSDHGFQRCSEDNPCTSDHDVTSAANAPSVSMGNLGSQPGEKKFKGQAGSAFSKEGRGEPKSASPSVGRFRFGKSEGKKQAHARKTSSASSDASLLCPEFPSSSEGKGSRRGGNGFYTAPQVVGGEVRGTTPDVFAETTPSPESSLSSSVYVDTQSHLPTPDDATIDDGDSLLDSQILDDGTTLKDISPGSISDITVFCDEIKKEMPLVTKEYPLPAPPVVSQSCPGTPDTHLDSLFPMTFQTVHDARYHSQSDIESSSYSSSIRDQSTCSSISSLGRRELNGSLSHDVHSKHRGSMDTAISGASTLPFTLTHHRKVVLPPHKFSVPPPSAPSGGKRDMSGSEECLRPAALYTNNVEQPAPPPPSTTRRHSSYGDVPPLDGNVLRKVASLTLDKATIDSKVNRPKFVPEKLDFSLYEKFEGQMLIHWLCSAFPDDHYLRFLLSKQDLKILAAQFCTHLLAAGVLRQIEDENAPQANLFRPDLMYYWTHSEPQTSSIPPPGKLSPSVWPTPTIHESPEHRLGLRYTEAELQSLLMNIKKEHKDTVERIQKEKEIALFNLRGEQASKLSDYETKLLRLEREVDKYQTLAAIEELTRKAKRDLDSSPVSPGYDLNFFKSCKTAYAQTETQLTKEFICQTDEPHLQDISVAVQTDCVDVKDSSSSPDKDFYLDHPFKTAARPSLVQAVAPLRTSEAEVPISSHEQSVPHRTEVKNVPSVPSSLVPPPPPPPPPPVSAAVPPPPPPPTTTFGHVPLPPPLPATGSGPPPPPPPPPPPLGSSGPPPPPPPPPPLGGSVPPPPPPPPPLGGSVPPPPPPPPPLGNGSGPPPPPPPPPMGGMPPPPPPLPSASGMNMGLPPIPPPSPSALLMPSPLPPPPEGGWYGAYSTARKPPVNPKVPMKPLYWTRIQMQQPSVSQEIEVKTCLWVNLEEALPANLEEFSDLFSRQTREKKAPSKTKAARDKTKKVAKLLDQKRSQNVGILISSLRVEISDVENAVYNFDTSTLDLDALQAIYEVRPTPEELKMIKAHMTSKPEVPLDKPEQFLYDLAQIPEYADRVSCIMFQATFTENIGVIENKLNNLKMTCEFLMTDKSLQKVLGIILALGNYMNGGNRNRGQADGFGLEILAKLKDVKSKDNSITLLHYIVITYVTLYQEECSSDKAKLPVPEPSDVERATLVNFDDISVDLKKLHSQIKGCEQKVEKVLSSSDEQHQQPFKDKMDQFLMKAYAEHKDQEENVEECKNKFNELRMFLSWNGKSGNPSEWPKELFSYWVPFCNDFKDIWKKEIQRKFKQDLEFARKKVKEIKEEKKATVVKVKDKPSGLKAKLAKKGMILSDSSRDS